MIPRLKPYLGKQERWALFNCHERDIAAFEARFAQTFQAEYGLAFRYGRSGLWAFLKAMEIENAEIIIPGYTCVVIAHAILLTNNVPRFVDISLHDYNMNLEQVAEAINERTRCIVATHLFGYPLNVDWLREIVRTAENRWGHKIWVVQDCAHAFGARWKGKPVCNAGDVGLFGLNISKMITSIFGGMITTNNPDLYKALQAFRQAHSVKPGYRKKLISFIYLLSVYIAFNEYFYGFVNFLQEKTPVLDRLTKAYHLDDKVHFPPDYLDDMLALEARVGLIQLSKYNEIIRRRHENAVFYHKHLPARPAWHPPPLVDGATYSHYVIRVPDRDRIRRALKSKGIELGELIEYSIPHHRAYTNYTNGQDFPNALLCSRSMINLPVHAHLSHDRRARVVDALTSIS